MVRDTDGSAFITKAEFDSLKNNFQAQIDNYNSSIDNKIDGAIASYLSGVKISSRMQIKSLFDTVGISNQGKKTYAVIGKNNKKWFRENWASGTWFGDFDLEPRNNYWTALTFGINNSNSPAFRHWHEGIIDWQLQFTRTNGSNGTVTAEGSGSDVERIRYGLRCVTYNHNYVRVTCSPALWLGFYPRFFGPDEDHSLVMDWVPEKPAVNASNSSGNGLAHYGLNLPYSGKNYDITSMYCYLGLRDSSETSSYPAYTPPRALRHSDNTFSTTGWSVIDPDVYAATSYWSSLKYSYNGYIMSSNPSDWYGDNMLYFWPGGGENRIFLFDQNNITANFKRFDFPTKADGSLFKWGDWTDLGISVGSERFRTGFSQDLRDLAESKGYTVLDHSGVPAATEIPIYIKGYIYDFDCENRRKELSTLRYAQPTTQLGVDVKLGETPLIIHDAQKTGKVTLDGSGICHTYSVLSSDVGPSKNVIVAFTKNGSINEVNNGTAGTPNWTVNNAIPFEYKIAGSSTWTSVPDGKLTIGLGVSDYYYNFRFDVAQGDDIYIHAVCPDYRDEQRVLVFAEPDTTCVLEAEE